MATFRIATRADEGVIKALLHEHPMDSWVSISMEREPSYFQGASLMGETYTLISEERDEVVGMYACSYLSVHINKKMATIGYLGAMRVREPFRHKIRYLKEGFDAIATMIPQQASVPFYLTSIATENLSARRLLESNQKGMPTYMPRGEMSSLVFSVRRGKMSYCLEQATQENIPEIVAFYNRYASDYQFSPCLSESWLNALDGDAGLKIGDFWLARGCDGTLQCCLALWDQRAFKQSVVHDYRQPLKQMRPLYNLYARMSRQVELPACGEALQHLFIAFFAYNDEAVAIRALKEAAKIAEQTKKVESCTLGLSSQHPLLPAIKTLFKPSVYVTEIETVLLNGTVDNISLEDRLVQPEVALL